MAHEPAPAVAFLTCSSYRINREAVLKVSKEAQDQITAVCRELDLSLVTSESVPASDEELARALRQIQRAEYFALILHYAGWTEDQTVLKIARSFACPVFLWVTSDILENGISLLVAHVGYMEAAVYLKKMNLSCARYYGGPDIRSKTELTSFLIASRTVWRLKGANFGWIGEGYGSEGILDSSFDEAVVTEKLGIQFQRVTISEVFARYNAIPQLRDGELREIREKYGVDSEDILNGSGMDRVSAEDSLRFLYALAKIVEEREIIACSLRCFPEFKQNDVPTPCLAVSALNSIGIPAACEGDVLAGVSMLILSGLSRSPATIMDVFSVDEERNTMDLFHCGSAAPAFAGQVKSPEFRTHCKPLTHRAGVTVEFPIGEGPLAFCMLDYLSGRLNLFTFSGQSLPVNKPIRGTCAVVKPLKPVKQLIEALIEHGVSHHMVLTIDSGTVLKAGEYFAKITGLDIVQF